MLSRNDKKYIKDLIHNEFKEALFRTIQIERGPRKQNDPEKIVKEEEWNILEFLATYFPYLEGALRGNQKDVDELKNKMIDFNLKIEAVGKVLLGLENSALKLAKASDNLKKLKKPNVPLPIGPINESNS